MALTILHKEVQFGVGDKVRVSQRIQEAEKERTQVFEGQVIAIKNRGENRSFTVRRIGEAGVGIERIFPLASPTLEKVVVVKRGTAGVARAKLYYSRDKSPKELEKIFARTQRREKAKQIHAAKKKRK